MHFITYKKNYGLAFQRKFAPNFNKPYLFGAINFFKKNLKNVFVWNFLEALAVSVAISEERAVCRADILSSCLTFETSSPAGMLNFSFA